MKLGLFVLRAVLGALMFGHGAQKVYGWFGGGGPDGTGQFLQSLGFTPGRDQAMRAGAAEMGGGALVGLGLATPIGAGLLSSVMSTAIWTVHRKNGPWVSDGGYEYDLMIMAALFALSDAGPGEWSLDERLGIDLSGPGWALAQLALGVGGAAVNLALASGEAEAGQAIPRAPDSPAVSGADL